MVATALTPKQIATSSRIAIVRRCRYDRMAVKNPSVSPQYSARYGEGHRGLRREQRCDDRRRDDHGRVHQQDAVPPCPRGGALVSDERRRPRLDLLRAQPDVPDRIDIHSTGRGRGPSPLVSASRRTRRRAALTDRALFPDPALLRYSWRRLARRTAKPTPAKRPPPSTSRPRSIPVNGSEPLPLPPPPPLEISSCTCACPP